MEEKWIEIINQQAKMKTWARSLILMHKKEWTPWRVTEIKLLSLFQGKLQSSDQKPDLPEIVSWKKNSSFHALGMPNKRDQRQRK